MVVLFILLIFQRDKFESYWKYAKKVDLKTGNLKFRKTFITENADASSRPRKRALFCVKTFGNLTEFLRFILLKCH
jgi:hypothetical protein